jgi:hypothetical protein
MLQLREPVIIHWLDDMFDPALTGYWGDTVFETAVVTALDVINRNAAGPVTSRAIQMRCSASSTRSLLPLRRRWRR